MTLIRVKSTGEYEGDFRSGGIRLHIRLRTKNKKEAQPRHDAIHKLVRQRRVEMIDQLRSGVLTVERVTAMMEHNEPLQPLTVAEVHSWGTVNECAERYIADIRDHVNRRESTAVVAAWQLSGLRTFEYDGKVVGELDLDAVTPEMIQAFQRSLVAAETPVNTISTVMSRVGALWRFVERAEKKEAREKRRAPRPVYSPVDPERVIRDTTRRERFLSEDEMALLFAATPEAARFPVFAGVMAGLRVDEMLHLRPSLDVDLEYGTLTIKDHSAPEWHPKTRRSRRTIPMAPPLLEAAKRHVAKYASAAWMMPSVRVTGPLTQDGWRKHFLPIVERAGLVFGRDETSGVTYHTLRHTFASHAVMKGVDLYTVAQLLGDSLQTVEQTYAHLSPDHKKAAIAKLSTAFRTDTASAQSGEPK